MHDEDNAIGLSVKNPEGQSWTVYGGKHAFGKEAFCVDAIQASVNEIYEAYRTKQVPLAENYRAWAYAPTLDSARAQQALAPLFNSNQERRKVIEKRTRWEFTNDYWFFTTAHKCMTSSLWKYPIVISKTVNIIPYTSIASTSLDSISRILVFYQAPGGGIIQKEHIDGILWSGGAGSPIFDAVLFTPLAAVNFKNGREVSVQANGIWVSANGRIDRFAFTISTKSTFFKSIATPSTRGDGIMEHWET